MRITVILPVQVIQASLVTNTMMPANLLSGK